MDLPRSGLATLALCLSFVAPAAAQSVEDVPALQLFARQMSGGTTQERLLQRLEKDFAELGTGGDAITSADVAVHEIMGAASHRVRRSEEIMQKDLDGDGFVTESEARIATRYDRRDRIVRGGTDASAIEERAVAEWAARDADGDGRVGWTEATALPEPDSHDGKAFANGNKRRRDTLKLVLQLDSDGDRRVTLPEFVAPAEALFHSVDADSDGTISKDEAKTFEQDPMAFVSDEARIAALAAAREREEQARLARARGAATEAATCAMPAPSAEAEVIAVGVQNLKALSSVAVGSQDQATHVGRLVVEPGDTPIYLVIVTTDAAIWRFTGATERIEHLVVHSITSMTTARGEQLPLVGTTGVPAARVTMLGRWDCMHTFTERPSVEAAATAAVIREQTGREPTMYAALIAGEVHVPSGEMPDGEAWQNRWPRYLIPGFGAVRIVGEPGNTRVITEPADTQAEFRRNSPDGVVEIDPAEVLAQLPVQPYTILPEEAGLLQLLEAGALTVNRRGQYIIHEKIRLPADTGANFLLLRGVPVPDGSLGRAHIFSEETGEEIDPRRG